MFDCMKKFRNFKEMLHEDHIGTIRLDKLQSNNPVPQFQYVKSKKLDVLNPEEYDRELSKEASEINKLAEGTQKILENLPNTFHEAIKYLRQKEELTQEGLEEKAGIPVKTIQRIESGGNQPSRKNFVKLCMGLELNPIIRHEMFNLYEWNLTNSLDRIKLKIILNDSYFDNIEHIESLMDRLELNN